MEHLIALLVLTILAPIHGSSPKCGIPTVKQGHVIGGRDAKAGAWPWQVAIYSGFFYTCGGSLVTPEWVITAAHCVQRYKNPRFYTIIMGTHDLGKLGPTVEFAKVKRVITHPNYKVLDYDLALLQLVKPVKLNRQIAPVCLPNATDVIPVGTKCFITGFGKIKHPGRSHRILQQADLPIVDSKVCKKLNSKAFSQSITDHMVCAGHGTRNPKGGCHGDSGGPLVCQYGNAGAWTLHGAVSWGSSKCSTEEAYTVFARITSFRPWIEKYIHLK